MNDELTAKARRVIAEFTAQRLKIATVESCTGGLIAAALTEIPGSSAVVDRGFVTYSNEAKSELVGVKPTLIETRGAVSPEVAEAMANGGISRSNADFAVAVTGIAGPGGSDFKPEGLVCFHAVARSGNHLAERIEFGPIGRSAVRRETVRFALDMLLTIVRRP